MAAVVGGVGLAGPCFAGASGTTTTTAPLTLAQWKHSYEATIGKIADDALVIWDNGRKAANHPTTKKVSAVVSKCQQWHADAESAPKGVPPIPQTSAERSWTELISASLSASTACVTALQEGSKSAAKRFDKQMSLVNADEKALSSQLSGSGT